MNYEECIELARPRIGKYCKACKECNGKACGNQIPGPGAKGIGDTAIRNYDKWKEIRVNMDTIAENGPVDISLELFGKKFRYPFFAGPVGAVNLHYGDCLNDISYNDILVSFCAEFGIAAFTGDGMDSNVMVAATKAIHKAKGLGVMTVKGALKAKEAGADAVIIARPFVTAVYGGGREGVEAYISKIGGELEDTMKMCGVSDLAEITGECIWKNLYVWEQVKGKRNVSD